MHPAAWLLWAVSVMVIALVTTNPLYLLVLLLSVTLVGVVAPRTEFASAGFRVMLIAGLGIVAFSVLVASINGGPGEQELFTIPGPGFPSWLGGLRIGGPVTAEALAAAGIRGLAILCVVLGFAVFNGACSPFRVLRLGPAALFQAGLVVTIGLTLLPASVEDFRRLREMRALRGMRTGPRELPGLVVPAVIAGMERAMRYAEAIEARGYAAPAPLPRLARVAGITSAFLALVAGVMWLYLDGAAMASLLVLALSLGAAAAWLMVSSRSRATTRMRPEPFPVRDRFATGAFAASTAAALALRAIGTPVLTYNPFAGLRAPEFEIAVLVLLAPVLAPAALLTLGRPRRSTTGATPAPAASSVAGTPR